jgi:beta-lactamase superfamily II metal-dependent hydrolase
VSTEKTAASEQPTQSTEQPMPAPTAKQTNPTIISQNKELPSAGGNLTVHFLDVGQGDSILLEHGDDGMLIYSGEIGKGDDVATYIKNEGIMSLDYVIATHPHSDHIGGMSVILNDFPIGHFVDSGYAYSSKTYENMLKAIDKKNIPFETPKRGDKINFTSGIDVYVLNPGSTYFTDDVNQNSVVLKVTDGKVTFLLMGDAGIQAENEIMKDGYNVDADILKVGHHGSRTASGTPFISAVSPEISVIEVGAGNDYGHPHQETLDRLQKVSKVYRTDLDGTITVTTDGSSYSVSTEK